MAATLANSVTKEVQLYSEDAVQVQFVLIIAKRRGADASYKIDEVIAVLENNRCPALRRTVPINRSGM